MLDIKPLIVSDFKTINIDKVEVKDQNIVFTGSPFEVMQILGSETEAKRVAESGGNVQKWTRDNLNRYFRGDVELVARTGKAETGVFDE